MKLLVAVMTCHRLDYYIDDLTTDWLTSQNLRSLNVEDRVRAIRETWGTSVKDADLKFFYGTQLRRTDIKPNQRPGTAVPAPALRQPLSDEIFLPCRDSYTGNSEKMKEICRYALASGYDYILRVDDDTLVFLDDLLKTDWSTTDYSGAPTDTFHPGSCVFLSKRAMQHVVDARITSYADDLWVGHVMDLAGIKTHDIKGIRHKFGVDYKVNPNKVEPGAVALHSCTPDVMRLLWTQRTMSLSAQLKDTDGVASKTTLSVSLPPASEEEKSSSSATSLTQPGPHSLLSDSNSLTTSASETIQSSSGSVYCATGSEQTSPTFDTSSTATSETS